MRRHHVYLSTGVVCLFLSLCFYARPLGSLINFRPEPTPTPTPVQTPTPKATKNKTTQAAQIKGRKATPTPTPREAQMIRESPLQQTTPAPTPAYEASEGSEAERPQSPQAFSYRPTPVATPTPRLELTHQECYERILEGGYIPPECERQYRDYEAQRKREQYEAERRARNEEYERQRANERARRERVEEERRRQQQIDNTVRGVRGIIQDIKRKH